MKKTICLNMIVKNEGRIIYDTLKNIYDHLPYDYYVISDTGSNDNTIEEIKRFAQEFSIEGEVYYDEWKNFAYNRNKALEKCINKTDYVLFFDADDRFWGDLILPSLELDRYSMHFRSKFSQQSYQRPLLVRNNGMFYWRGVVHEFITTDSSFTHDLIDGEYGVISGRFGDRNNNPNKYMDDAKILEKGYENEPDLRQRYAFYIGQSYRDAKKDDKAIEWYQLRTTLGGWEDEIGTSYCEIGKAYERLEQYDTAFINYLKGYNAFPNRSENLYYAAKLLRKQNQLIMAYQLAKIAIEITKPRRGIFLNSLVYDYLLDFELSITSYYVKDFGQGYVSCRNILFSHCKKDMKITTINNLVYYKNELKNDTLEHLTEILDIIVPVRDDAAKASELISYINNVCFAK